MSGNSNGVVVDIHPDHSRFWKNLGVILGTLIAAATVCGALFKAFYVTRDEYNSKIQIDSSRETSTQKTLDYLNETIRNQREAFDRQNNTIMDLKADVAVLKSQQRHGRDR